MTKEKEIGSLGLKMDVAVPVQGKHNFLANAIGFIAACKREAKGVKALAKGGGHWLVEPNPRGASAKHKVHGPYWPAGLSVRRNWRKTELGLQQARLPVTEIRSDLETSACVSLWGIGDSVRYTWPSQEVHRSRYVDELIYTGCTPAVRGRHIISVPDCAPVDLEEEGLPQLEEMLFKETMGMSWFVWKPCITGEVVSTEDSGEEEVGYASNDAELLEDEICFNPLLNSEGKPEKKEILQIKLLDQLFTHYTEYSDPEPDDSVRDFGRVDHIDDLAFIEPVYTSGESTIKTVTETEATIESVGPADESDLGQKSRPLATGGMSSKDERTHVPETEKDDEGMCVDLDLKQRSVGPQTSGYRPKVAKDEATKIELQPLSVLAASRESIRRILYAAHSSSEDESIVLPTPPKRLLPERRVKSVGVIEGLDSSDIESEGDAWRPSKEDLSQESDDLFEDMSDKDEERDLPEIHRPSAQKKVAAQAWAVEQGKKSSGKPRCRSKVDGSTEGGRRKKCPICHEFKSGNMRRHFANCHSEVPHCELEVLLVTSKEEGGDRKTRRYDGICPICDKKLARVDKHLYSFHELRGEELAEAKASVGRDPIPVVQGNTPRKVFESLMEGFYTFLTSKGGLATKPAQAKPMVAKVKSAIGFITPPTTFTFKKLQALGKAGDTGGIFDRLQSHSISSDGDIAPRNTPLTSGTMANYVLAISRFMEYLRDDINRANAVCSVEKFEIIVRHVSRAVAHYNKLRTEEAAQVVPDTTVLVTPEQVQGYFESEIAVACVELLQAWKGKEGLQNTSKEVYAMLRSHLMIQIEVLNGKRAGDLANLTIKQVSEGIAVGTVDFIVRVAEHKVRTKPCNINLLGDLRWMVQLFIEKARADCFPDSKLDFVFLNLNGSKMTSSQVVLALNDNWAEYRSESGEDLPRLTTSTVRKAIVTLHRAGLPSTEAEDRMAAQMAHNKLTADRWYDLSKASAKSVSATREIAKLWTETRSSEVPLVVQESDDEDTYPEQTRDTSDAEVDVEMRFDDEKEGSESDNETETVATKGPVSQRQSTSGDTATARRPIRTWRRVWNVEDGQKLARAFRQYIDERAADPRKKIVNADIERRLSKESSHYSSLLESHTLKQIGERLRYLVRCRRKEAV